MQGQPNRPELQNVHQDNQVPYAIKVSRSPLQPIRLASVVIIIQGSGRKDFSHCSARFLSHQTRENLVFGVRCMDLPRNCTSFASHQQNVVLKGSGVKLG